MPINSDVKIWNRLIDSRIPTQSDCFGGWRRHQWHQHDERSSYCCKHQWQSSCQLIPWRQSRSKEFWLRPRSIQAFKDFAVMPWSRKLQKELLRDFVHFLQEFTILSSSVLIWNLFWILWNEHIWNLDGPAIQCGFYIPPNYFLWSLRLRIW